MILITIVFVTTSITNQLFVNRQSQDDALSHLEQKIQFFMENEIQCEEIKASS